MNKKDLTVVSIQALNRANYQILKLTEKNEDLIKLKYNSSKLIFIEDVESNSNFKFEIQKIEQNPLKQAVFIVELSPVSNSDNKRSVKRFSEKEIINEFSNWISWLKVFENIHLTPEDEFLKMYQDEFYSEFEIVEEESATSPFSVKQQLFLDDYLNYIEIHLIPESNDNEEIQEILNDVKLLRENLGKASKKKIIKGISKIFAKLRKSSIRLLGEFYNSAKKEVIKRLVNGSLDQITDLIE